MEQLHFTLSKDFFVGLFKEKHEDAFAKLMEEILNQVLIAESNAVIGAEPYQRTEERTDSRNGFRERDLNLRIGKLTLRVPRHRNKPFKTTLFDEYKRNEQALIVTMMEMVANGVASRNVQKITEQLCGTKFSKSTVSELCKQISVPVEHFRTRRLHDAYPFLFVDAIYFKVREHGRAVSQAFMVALAIQQNGHKEILGFDLYDNESEETWKAFLNSLKERGLTGVDMVTSDAHPGLRSAIQQCFPHIPWQRCQFHFTKNIMDKVKKKDQKPFQYQLRDMFNANTMEEARRLRDALVDEYSETNADAIRILEDGFEDAMTVMSLPQCYRKHVRTSNVLERENRELRKRQNPIGIFENKDSVLRLMGAVLYEDHEDWAKGNRSYSMDEYYEKHAVIKKGLDEQANRFASTVNTELI